MGRQSHMLFNTAGPDLSFVFERGTGRIVGLGEVPFPVRPLNVNPGRYWLSCVRVKNGSTDFDVLGKPTGCKQGNDQERTDRNVHGDPHKG